MTSDVDQKKSYYLSAIRLLEEMSIEVAVSYNKLGELFGDHKEAMQCYIKALKVYEP